MAITRPSRSSIHLPHQEAVRDHIRVIFEQRSFGRQLKQVWYLRANRNGLHGRRLEQKFPVNYLQLIVM